MPSGILTHFFKSRLATFAFASSLNRLQCWKHSEVRTSFNMDEAYLRYREGDQTFEFSFRYTDQELNVDKQFNFVRTPLEPVSRFLKRVNANLDKYLSVKTKKQAKKRGLPLEQPQNPQTDNVDLGNIMIMKNDSKIDLDEPCKILFENPSEYSLRIFSNAYKIRMNVPWVTKIRLSSSILAGIPTYPKEFETLYTNKDKCTFTWFKNASTADHHAPAFQKAWEKVGEGFFYTPTNNDVNCYLKLKCIPANEEMTGPPIEAESSVTVEAGIGECPCDTRHAFTRDKLTGHDFRIVSYNLLADVYASTDYSKNNLFPYCPPYALEIDYRKQLMIKELMGFNADIICLQEVDSKVYETDLMSVFSILHYDGSFTRKGGILSEGVATLFDTRRFEMLGTKHTVMGQDVEIPGFPKVWSRLTNETVKARFQARSTSIQATILRSKENPSNILVVGNTHLYFQPDADHIRLLQAFYAICFCQDVAQQAKQGLTFNTSVDVRIILCGDFNSTPECGVYQLLTTGHVSQNQLDWKSNPDEVVENLSIENKFLYGSACGTPEYTNFTEEFAACLDYIFYESKGFEVTQVVPFPSKEELSLNRAIPSPLFPSDHVSLCADLKWLT